MSGLTAGPDGNVWFTNSMTHEVGRITPSGDVTLFPVSGVPNMITAGPDGNLWYTELAGAGLGRITPSGQVTEFPLHLNCPMGITAGPDGTLWVAGQAGGEGAICRVTTGGVVTQYAVPWAGAAPDSITTAPDGNIWFTDFMIHAIGELVINPPPTASGSAMTAIPGQSFSGTVATITALDPSLSPANMSATIDWGDGSITAGKIVAEAPGVFAVTGTGAYAQSGTYAIHVSISTGSSRTLSATSTADVALPPPPPANLGGPPMVWTLPPSADPTTHKAAIHIAVHHKVTQFHHQPPHHQKHHAPA